MDVYHQVKHRYRFPQWLESLTFPEAHNREGATFILGLRHVCYGVFTDRLVLDAFYSTFYREKGSSAPL